MECDGSHMSFQRRFSLTAIEVKTWTNFYKYARMCFAFGLDMYLRYNLYMYIERDQRLLLIDSIFYKPWLPFRNNRR